LDVIHFHERPVDRRLALVEEDVEMADVDRDVAVWEPREAADEATSGIMLVIADAKGFDFVKEALERFKALVAVIPIVGRTNFLAKFVIALLVLRAEEVEKSWNSGFWGVRHEVIIALRKIGKLRLDLVGRQRLDIE
jgi:hypothetical protein